MPETDLTKNCTCCKELKELGEFHRAKNRKDGYQSYCKSCSAAYTKHYRQTGKGKTSNNQACARYFKTKKGKVARKRYLHSKKGKAYRKKGKARYTEKHPNEIKARLAISHEIESGRMESATAHYCEHCGEQATHYHHHRGYEPEHWLDVVALCRKCDITDHRQMSLAKSS